MWTLIKWAVQRVLRAAGYTIVRLPPRVAPAELGAARAADLKAGSPQTAEIDGTGKADQPIAMHDRFAEIDALLARATPWSGNVAEGYVANFLGVMTDGSFLWNKTGPFGGHYVKTALPTVSSEGEGFFEIADWFYSARDARGQYVAISLGASYGAQLVGAWKTLQLINPLPCRLVAVDPVPENCERIRKHMADNGIDPDAHWIMQAAIGVDNQPNLFPVGAPGTGLQASMQTNSSLARQAYANFFETSEYSGRVLKNIFLHNSTGVKHDLSLGYSAEVEFISAVTLRDVLAPFDRVDLLEVDIQRAEAIVIAPFMNHVNRKVRRVHLGTHGREAHAMMRRLFAASGWEFVFDYSPDTRHITERGPLEIGDGILSVVNPKL